MQYETLKVIAILSLIVYFLGGIATNPYPIFGEQMYRRELYPFFSWFLFAEIPNPRPTTSMQLLSYGGTTYDQPLPFEKTGFLFEAIGQYPTQYLPIIRAFARELERSGNVEPHRSALEKLFKEDASYRIVRLEYDQVAYWKTGSTTRTEVLGTFTAR